MQVRLRGTGEPVLTGGELGRYVVVKFGYQDDETGRQDTHNQFFRNSILLDSFVTLASCHLEQRAKDIWSNTRQLYEGIHVASGRRQKELLLISSQEEYKEKCNLIKELMREIDLEMAVQRELRRLAEAEDARTEQLRVQLETL